MCIDIVIDVVIVTIVSVTESPTDSYAARIRFGACSYIMARCVKPQCDKMCH